MNIYHLSVNDNLTILQYAEKLYPDIISNGNVSCL